MAEPPTTDPGRERIRSLAEEIVSKQGRLLPQARANWLAAWSARLRVFEEEIRAEREELVTALREFNTAALYQIQQGRPAIDAQWLHDACEAALAKAERR